LVLFRYTIMAKQDRSKQAKKGKGGGRPAPYSKPKVEVRFEKDGRTASAQAKATNGVTEVTSKDKGKGKAEVASPVEAPKEYILPSSATSAPASTSFIIVAGSYEKLLYGIEGSYPSSSSDGVAKPEIKPIFIFPAHLACVKAVAASPGGKWLATGSEDEFVKVWDLRRRKEVGSLSQHTGED
jgi:protein MAK11